MGLDVYVTYPDVDGDLKSEKYPEHMCNRSYLRSSYNEGGFNSVVGKLIGKELYYIFGMAFDGASQMPGYVEYDEETGEGGWWVPTPEQLQGCRERALEVVAELGAILRPLRCFDQPIYPFNDNIKPLSATEAIQYVYDQITKQQESYDKLTDEQKASGMWGGAFSNGQGHFFLDEPIKIVATVQGQNVLGAPCVHVVYEDDITYYIQTAEIVVEMIDTMLANPGARMSWSG